MTGKTQAARQPSIDDLLTSIRQAIHERVTPDASARSPVAERTRPSAAAQAGAETGAAKRTIVTGGREGFAGLLGGDVRLEEALARLNQPAWRRAADAPVAANPANSQTAAAPAPEPPAPEPRLRPTIDDWNTGRAMPAAGRTTEGELLSSRAASAANSAFSRLTDATAPRSPRAERPLDEMTRDCLRPLLKAWLDENLPGMVERLVREEIARVARRGS